MSFCHWICRWRLCCVLSVVRVLSCLLVCQHARVSILSQSPADVLAFRRIQTHSASWRSCVEPEHVAVVIAPLFEAAPVMNRTPFVIHAALPSYSRSLCSPTTALSRAPDLSELSKFRRNAFNHITFVVQHGGALRNQGERSHPLFRSNVSPRETSCALHIPSHAHRAS